MCELGNDTQQKLLAVVPNIGAVHNPIDLTAGYFFQRPMRRSWKPL
ncbi:hypothetical protein ACFS4T_20025 [Pseudomonas lini]